MARGNPAMRAKRVTGPSPNAELLQRVRCEHCDKCSQAPLITSTRPGIGTIVRRCSEHMTVTRDEHAPMANGAPWRK
jgi:hypothetical protein